VADHSLLSQCLDIHQFLERDENQALSERTARDRGIGRELKQQDDTARVLAWWRAMQAQGLAKPAQANASVAARISTVKRWLTGGLVVAGLVVGASACAVALAYDGRNPVNLLAFLGVMDGLPLGLMLMTLFSMVLRLGNAGRRVPPPVLHTNRWLMGVWGRFSGTPWLADPRQSRARGVFAYWQVLAFNQMFSAAFFVGALLMFALLVAVTDLAFGWSTTLQIEAAQVHAWVAALAAPWRNIWPSAAPDLSLVEVSRFYRLQGSVADAPAVQLGQWWPFVFMMLLCWGLLPRIVLLLICRWRLIHATRALLRDHHEVTALLDRMVTPQIALGEHADAVPGRSPQAVEVTVLPEVGDAYLVVLNNALEAQLIGSEALHLSSLTSAAEQQQAIQGLPASVSRALVVVKAWEPPMFEVLDLLQALRARLGQAASIIVAPVGLPDEHYQPTAGDLQVWSAAVAQLGDPGIYVAQAERGVVRLESDDG
jgi:hypothetical protein